MTNIHAECDQLRATPPYTYNNLKDHHAVKGLHMLYTGDPGVNRKLQSEAEALLERWITPCYVSACEHIAVSANDQGEIWLSGLVHDDQIVQEAVRLLGSLGRVHFVFNYVTVKHTGDAITL